MMPIFLIPRLTVLSNADRISLLLPPAVIINTEQFLSMCPYPKNSSGVKHFEMIPVIWWSKDAKVADEREPPDPITYKGVLSERLTNSVILLMGVVNAQS